MPDVEREDMKKAGKNPEDNDDNTRKNEVKKTEEEALSGMNTPTKEALKPITKVHSKLDKELQELEVESTKGGINAE
jgi:hypothetical protein